MTTFKAVGKALAELNDPTSEQVVAHTHKRFGVKVRQSYIPVCRATMRQRRRLIELRQKLTRIGKLLRESRQRLELRAA